MYQNRGDRVKQKKGFTLVELLGIVVILAILIILVAPNILDSSKGAKQKSYDTKARLIESSAVMYAQDNYGAIVSNCASDANCVKGDDGIVTMTMRVSELVSKDYLVADTDEEGKRVSDPRDNQSSLDNETVTIKVNTKSKKITANFGDNGGSTPNPTPTPDPVPSTVTVHFNADGGTISGKSSIQVQPGKKYGVLPDVTKEGFEFVGWFDKNGKKIESSTTVEDENEHSLTARWNELEISYTLTLNFNYDGSSKPMSTVYEKDEPVFLITPARTGYKFIGWYTDPIGGTKFESQTIDRDMTLYAHWEEEVKKYTVTFRDSLTSTTYKNASDIVENTDAISLAPQVSKTNYIFNGWSKSQTGSIVNSLPVTGNVTLYARWTKKTLTLVDTIKNSANTTTSYSSGNTAQAYRISHSSTSQTSAQTSYRYIGGVPNNYVKFNGNETWRIVGVFDVDNGSGTIEQRVKLVRDYEISKSAWDTAGSRVWANSSLKSALNNDYYYNTGAYETIGLNSTARSQIGSAKWYLRGCLVGSDKSATQFYKCEREGYSVETSSDYIVQNVGLLYPSDYLYTYANGVNTTCFTDSSTGTCSTPNGNPEKGWLYYRYGPYWTLTPESTSNSYGRVFYTASDYANSYYYGGLTAYTSNTSYAIRPTVYLRKDVKTTSGDGSYNNPYILQ